ncbi:elongation of very long chain fatty acids protein 4-like [Sitodiplosis mosellana]|uniref:elongation of very long chain fatty acids protein 4-like n=1 Tax=Sitodiplosis mosellana TaxID=263140 RepID=UPI002444A063|nr:elongation of very long chain fatty acids protein 4-like [Sitodiplosis mosellana]
MDKNTTSNNIITRAIDFYEWTLSLSDTRTKGMLFVDSPTPTILLTLGYLLIVYIGPKIMRNRKPFELKQTLLTYNLAVALLNLYIASELLVASISLKYNYICQPYKQIYSKDELRITHAIWWFYFSKCIEFCDSFFFILRKKDIQLTFLHVYHHSTMFPLWWIGVKYVPSGSTFLPAMTNSFIHVLMYSYYGLSTFGPNVTKYLWWKKYLTIIQLIQFTGAMILGINGITNGCDFPMWMQYALVIYMISFIVLFGNFYAIAYLSKGKAEPISSVSHKTIAKAALKQSIKQKST